MSTEAEPTTWEEIPERLYGESRARLRRGSSRRMLHVAWVRGFLHFTLYPEAEEIGELELPRGYEDIADLLERCSRLLDTLSSRRYLDPEKQESAWVQLVALGDRLFQRLLPSNFRERVRRWPDRAFLGISTNEDWVPWELLHDGKGFLGQRLLLVRMPRLRWREGAAAVGRGLNGDAGTCRKILNVVGGGLDRRVDECTGLFAGLAGAGIEVRLLHGEEVSVLQREIRDADLVHFTCHGHRDPLRLQIYKTDDPLLNLHVDIVGMEGFHLKPRCLVYANACSSATAELVLGNFVGFGWEFYSKGAAAFIGTLGTVPAEQALALARRFYARLAGDSKGDVYHAYQAARREATERDLACLLVCIYGNCLDETSLNLMAEGERR